MNNDKIKYFSMFTGIGGFELGIERANDLRWLQQDNIKGEGGGENNQKQRRDGNSRKFSCVGFSEIDKYANQLLAKRFPNIPNFGDCTKIEADKLPDFDMLCGGFPCQAFSIAGKRKGFGDTRGTLFFEIARILKIKRPKIILLENVKGLLNHNKGETFRVIIQTLSELGYDVQWMVLNSKFFGVPQNRERVFIIGSLRGTSRPEILPFEGADTETNLKYVGAIMSEKNKQWLENGKQFSRNFPQGQRVYGVDGCSSTLAGNAGGLGGKTGLYAVLTPNRPEKRQNGRRFKEDGEPSFTLTGQDIHGVMIQVHNMQPRSPDRPSLKYSSGGSGHLQRDDIAYCLDGGNTNAVEFEGTQIRRLTPTECERLQGFPDNWTEGFSDTQRYKMLGNAVTVNVVEAVIDKMLPLAINKKEGE